MYEEHCDLILKEFDKNIPNHWDQQTHILNILESNYSSEIAVRYYHIIIAILIDDAHIEKSEYFVGGLSNYYDITAKGRSFINTTSYVQRKHERELQIQLNEKATLKADQDLRLNSWLLKTRWLPHILSFVSIVVAIAAVIISIKYAAK